MDKPFIIIGAGGHSKVIIEILQLVQAQILGVTIPINGIQASPFKGIDILGDDSIIDNYSAEEIYLVNGIGSIGSDDIRRKVYNKFRSKGYRFPPIVHPSAIISASSKIGEGVQIMAGVIINASTIIEENTIINTRASIDHDCVIGSHVHIAPGVTLCGGVIIGDGAHIGSGTTIIQNRTVGKGSLVAAGSVVVDHIAEGSKVMGVPAKEAKK